MQAILPCRQASEQFKRRAIAGAKPRHQHIGVQNNLGRRFHGIADDTALSSRPCINTTNLRAHGSYWRVAGTRHVSRRRMPHFKPSPEVPADFDLFRDHFARYAPESAPERMGGPANPRSQAADRAARAGRQTRAGDRPRIAGLCGAVPICGGHRHRVRAGAAQPAGSRLQALKRAPSIVILVALALFAALALAPALAKVAPDIVLIGVPMAFHAVVEVADAFLNVFAADFLF